MDIRYSVMTRDALIEANVALQSQNKIYAEKLAELTTHNKINDDKIEQLSFQLKELQRMLFGSKSERFLFTAPNQLGLFAPVPEPPVEEKKIGVPSHERSKRKEKPVRSVIPAHFKRVDVPIELTEDTTELVEIGEVVSEHYEYTPGSIYVARIVRKKYADPKNPDRGVLIAPMPSMPIDKCLAGATLLAIIIIDKYCDHIPLYRQRARLKRAGIFISSSTFDGWFKQSCDLLFPLYEALCKEVFSCDYLGVDETPIPVMDKETKGKTHRGWYWVFHDVLNGLVVFNYKPGRDGDAPEDHLKDFKGHLQTDAYGVYKKYETRPGIIPVGCMTHNRRYYDKALDSEHDPAEYMMKEIQQLYNIERKADQENYSHDQKKEIRQKEAVPILNRIKQWLDQECLAHAPSKLISKAIGYSLNHWEKLCIYTTDGRLRIDNNLIENTIRPVALGRKNYMFAGSHEGAQRGAMMYSFMASCKLNNVNPWEWLSDVLQRIKEHPANRLSELLPGKWKPLPKKIDM